MTTYLILSAVSGALIGVITPNCFGREWWKFWLGMVAVLLAVFAGLTQ